MLTKREIDFYNENGFITVDKVILDNEICALKKIQMSLLKNLGL